MESVELKVVVSLSPTNLLYKLGTYEANGIIGMYMFPMSIHRGFRARECQCRWQERRLAHNQVISIRKEIRRYEK